MKELNEHINDRYLALWLEDTISDEELKNLISHDDFLAYQKIKKGLLVLEKPDADTFLAIQDSIKRKAPRVVSMRKAITWAASIAASVIILMIGYLFFEDSTIEITTSFAEQKNVTLLDGSQVVLNAKSRLAYDEKEWEGDRRVTLEGEAYFKVAKGSTFTVETKGGHVTVLGTEFNVIESLDYFEVSCYEGRVMVATSALKSVLLPGNSVRKINGNHLEKGKVLVEGPSWVSGESSFTSVPIRYVINALEKQYQVTFESKGVDLNSKFTGSFTNHNLEVALATVFTTMNIHYSEKQIGTYILSDMNEK